MEKNEGSEGVPLDVDDKSLDTTPDIEHNTEALFEEESKGVSEYKKHDSDKPHRRQMRPGEAITCRPLEVKVFEGKMDKAIRMLKNRLAKEGVLKEIKRRRHYSKPSEQKRIKARDAARRRRKAAKTRKP